VIVDSVYTETELKYYIDVLQKVSRRMYEDQTPDPELRLMLQTHTVKAQSTLKWLMMMIGFDYYYERILFRYQSSELE
jgi:hypothetical protein